MKELYSITNIVDTKGEVLTGWTIWVQRDQYACEYQTEIYYKDGMKYWISYVARDLVKLIDDTIDKIKWIVENIPEDALNSKQQWSHVKSFGNYCDREFIMLLKCNGRAELRRFCKTSDIFNHCTNYIPDSIEMLEENWSKEVSPDTDVKITDDNIKNNAFFVVNMFNEDNSEQGVETEENDG